MISWGAYKRPSDTDANTTAYFMSVRGSLMEMNLSLNEIGDKGTKAIGAAMADSKLSNNIDISIGEIGAMHIAKAIRACRSLMSINLAHNCIHDQCIQQRTT